MDHELSIRLGVFLGLFAVLAVLETLVPRRARVQARGARWMTNLSFTVLNTLALRVVAVALPLLAVGAALDAQAMGWGLFNRLGWSLWLPFRK